MKGGYIGKIVRVNLIIKLVSIILIEKYIEFGGGYGIGLVIFFDLVGDQLLFEVFDFRNLIIMMIFFFLGINVFGLGRCEVQGFGFMFYFIEWFGYSNFGG